MADIKGRGSDMEGPYAPTSLQLMINSLEKPLSRYPTQEDAAFARQQGFDYAHPHSPYLNNMKSVVYKRTPTNINEFVRNSPDVKEIPHQVMTTQSSYGTPDPYLRAELAAKRSALAKLGMDPDKTVLDFTPRPRGGVAGVYVPKTQQTYVRADNLDEGSDPISTITHEAIHRGTHRLMESPYWDPAWNKFGVMLPKGLSERFPEGNNGSNNEAVVRWLMQSRMGDPETAGAPGNPDYNQKQDARELFNPNTSLARIDAKKNAGLLEAMEAAAARMLKDKNPRGPR